MWSASDERDIEPRVALIETRLSHSVAFSVRRDLLDAIEQPTDFVEVVPVGRPLSPTGDHAPMT